MAISKINTGAIHDDAIKTAKIQDDAVTDPKIVDSYTTSVKTNPEFQGTEAARMPVGTTAERANAQAGDIRFNSTSALMEYYDGNNWKSIDSPPVVSSISPTTETDPNANITISGDNFATSVTVKFVGNDGTEYSSPSVTRNSTTEIVATTPATALSVANEPYDIVVTNTSSSLSGTLADALDAGGVPAFNESAGSLGTVYDSARTGLSFDAGAVDPDSDTITYSVSVGALPSGLSLNTSTGAITGTATAVGSDTTTTFTISAATSSDTSTREFSITVAAPVVTVYTSVGSGTFSVPTGLTSLDTLVVGGGGSGGSGGGGGAGGLIYRPAFPVTPGGSVSYSVGGGGVLPPGAKQTPAPWPNSTAAGSTGQNSTFGSLTALGGGGGGAYDGSQSPDVGTTGRVVGSGGGGGAYSGPVTGGTAQQPSQPGDSGTYGFGNPGGQGITGVPFATGGGGGAGAAGGQGNRPAPGNAQSGQGGIGKTYNISGTSYYYAGGGGGGTQAPQGAGIGGDGGQGGGGGGTVWQAPAGGYFGAGAPMYNGNVGEGGTHNQAPASGSPASAPAGAQGNAINSPSWADGGDAADNSGGGGGGAGISVTYAGAGGSGIVIVKY